MDLKDAVKNYLNKTRVMQLATSAGNQSWTCHLHYYTDEGLSFYWVSTLERRHSQELVANPNCSVAILVHEDTPDSNYIIGISAEGTAKPATRQEAERVSLPFRDKLDKDPQLIQDIIAGRNAHIFYRFTPTKLVLFDTKNFPDDPRKEIDL